MKRLFSLIKKWIITHKEEHFALFRSVFYTFFSKKIKCTGLCMVSKKSVICLKKKSLINVKGSLYICNSFADIVIGSTLILHENAHVNIVGTARICGACIQVWPNGYFESGNLKINAFTKINIQSKAIFGNNVFIARLCYITDTNSHDIIIDGKPIIKQKDLFIGNNVWICANCNLLRGVNIGDNVVIGANTTLSSVLESNTLVKFNNIIDKKSIERFIF